MQIGIRLHDGEKLPLEQLLPVVSLQGFRCTQLALSKSIHEYTTDPGAMTPGLAMYLKRLFQENNLDIAVLGCYDNLANPDKTQLDRIKEKYLAHIRFASVLGCGVVGTETGAPNTEYKFEKACHSNEAFEKLICNLQPVVDYAEKMGVIIGIEPVYKHIVYSAERARILLDRIGSPNLQIIFDPVNLLSFENISKKDEIIKDAINLLNKDIAIIHLKDYIIDNGQLVAVTAGGGNMDYSDIIKFIKKQKPYIQVMLENTKPENAVATKNYIQNLWDKCGDNI